MPPTDDTPPDAQGHLKTYLRIAEIADLMPPIEKGGGHRLTAAARLRGGLLVHVKYEGDDQLDEVHREVAAYEVAKLLGWGDLVPTTALRSMPVLGEGRSEMAAVQVMVLPNEVRPDLGEFRQQDRVRAAVFDYLIQNSDRRDHNWLGVRDDAGELRPILIDHGRSFGRLGRSMKSAFAAMEGFVSTLDAEILASLRGLQEAELSRLRRHLEPEEVRDMLDRVDTLTSDEYVPHR